MSSIELIYEVQIVLIITKLLMNENLFTDGQQFRQKLTKSMQEMEKILDNKAIFISVFGQHNWEKYIL